MTEHYIYALLFVVPGSITAGIALHAAVSLSATFTDLRLKAAEQERDVPPLAALYFRNTVRVLFVTCVLYLVSAVADVLMSTFAEQRLGLVGYASGVILLVCGFVLLLQGRTDGHLKLMKPKERLAHSIAGLLGIASAAWGMILVTWLGSVWP